MKKFLLYFFLLASAFSIGIAFFYYRQITNDKILSPLPDFLNNNENKEVSTLDFWLPQIIGLFSEKDNAPVITAMSALVYDLTDDKVLFEKNPHERLPMASLTKIMTAVVAIENKRKDNVYTVTPNDLVGENVMGLSSGESLSLEELLHGLVLNSGNDAAEVLAENTLGRGEFITAMNKKAKSLGLKDTNFTNPSGLEGDGDQHTTSYDLLVLTRFALEHYPLFAKVVSTPEYFIDSTDSHKAFDLVNETNLLTSYPGVKGVKDGYTYEAGLCLVTYLDYKGHKLIGVILGSDDRRGEMKMLLDYSLNSIGIKPPEHS